MQYPILANQIAKATPTRQRADDVMGTSHEVSLLKKWARK